MTAASGHRFRTKRVVVLATLLFLVLFAVALLWGSRDSVCSWIAGRMLSADVSIQGIRIGNPIRFELLEIRDLETTQLPALFTGEGGSLVLGRLFGRHLKAIEFDHVTLQVSDTTDSNYDFLIQLLNAPSSMNPLPYLPESILLPSISLEYTSPVGGLRLEKLTAEGQIETLDQMRLALHGQAITGTWIDAQSGAPAQPIGGQLEAAVSQGNGEIQASVDANLPGLLEWSAKTKVMMQPDMRVEISMEPGTLSSGLWAQMLSTRSGYKIQFDTARVSGGALTLKTGDRGMYADVFDFEASADSVQLGPAEAPEFKGSVTLELKGGGGTSGLFGSASIRLGDAPPLQLKLTTRPDAMELALDAVTLTRAQVAALLPSSLGGYLDLWPALHSAEIAGTCTMGADSTTIAGRIVPETTASVDTPLAITAAFPSSGDVSATLATSLKDAGAWTFEYTGKKATLSLDKAEIARWFGDVLGYPVTASGIRLDGSATLALESGTVDLDISAKRDGTPLGKLTCSGGSLSLGESKSTLPLRLRLDMASTHDLLGGPEVGGELDARGVLHASKDALRLKELAAKITSLRYGENYLPESPPLEISGTLQREPDSGGMSGSLRALWGKDFSLESTNLVYGTQDSGLSAEHLTLTSNANLFNSLGLLKSGEFTLHVSADGLSRAGSKNAGMVRGDLKGGLVLPEGLLAIKSADLQVAGNLADESGLHGPVTVDEVAAFGASIRQLTGQFRLAASQLIIEDATATLFGGTAKGRCTVDLMDESVPVSVDITLENADLTRFTEEFQPPDVQFTGMVSGAIRAAFAGEKITDLDVDLKSGEGFTLNRATVAKILMSQEVGELTGSGLADKIVKSVVGEEEARPFTGAELKLGLAEGRITGEALLKSKSLNLTVDIRADQAALFEALRMRQEGQVASFSTELK